MHVAILADELAQACLTLYGFGGASGCSLCSESQFSSLTQMAFEDRRLNLVKNGMQSGEEHFGIHQMNYGEL